MADQSLSERLKARRQELLDPLREDLDEIERGIAEHEHELGELRKMRTELRNTLRTLGDESQAVKRKASTNGGASNSRISEARLGQVVEWLRTHRSEFPDGFCVAEVCKHPEWDVAEQTALNKAVRILHERGVMRLDHVGARNKHFYKLTEA